MNKSKFWTIFMAGMLIYGCLTKPIFAAYPRTQPYRGQNLETLEFDPEYYIRNRNTTENSSEELEQTAAAIKEDNVEIGVAEFSQRILYTTYQKGDPPEDHLQEPITLHGDTYHFSSAETPVLIKKEMVVPMEISYESEVFTGDAELHSPEAVIQKDGREYKLISKEVIERTAEERSDYQQTVIRYEQVEAGVEIPSEKQIEFTDTDTNQTVQSTLEEKNRRTVKEYWSEDFNFPITITGYDADTFLLNGREIPNDADLAAYSTDFLEYLKLDPAYYIISDISWSGGAYENDGSLLRNAIAKGSKFVRDIDVTYGGNVNLPAIIGKAWSCRYEEVIPVEKSTVYTMAVEATYQLENMPITEKSFGEKIRDKIVGVITAAYQAVLVSIREYPGIAVIPLVLIALFVALFLGKNRKQCPYNKKKCIHRNNNEKRCKSCKNNPGIK